jgi:hypothetical protein
VLLREIVSGESGILETKFAYHAFKLSSVFRSYLNEKVDITRIARAAMIRHGMSANDNVFNAVGV